MEYIAYYFAVGLVLLIRNKNIFIIFFTLIWFAFVGLRYENGVDWFQTLGMMERGIEIAKNFSNSFIGYNLVDSEILYKFISLALGLFDLPASAFIIIVSAIEAFLIHQLLKCSPNYKIAAMVIMATFTLHFGFNAIRQGLALISLVAAIRIMDGRIGIVSTLVALTSHWASLPLISGILFYTKLKKYFVLYSAIFVIAIFGLFFYLPLDLFVLRFGEAPAQYEVSGVGLKFLFALCFSLITLIFIKPENYKFLIAIITILYCIVLLYSPFMRFFYFTVYFALLYSSTYPVKSNSAKVIILTFAFSLGLFEWQEILRFKSCENCGEWFPYNSIILN